MKATMAENEPTRGTTAADIVRTWGAAVLRPYMTVARRCESWIGYAREARQEAQTGWSKPRPDEIVIRQSFFDVAVDYLSRVAALG